MADYTTTDTVQIAIKRLKLAKDAVDKQRKREIGALKFQVPELQWTDEMRQGRSRGSVAGVELPERPMLSIPSLNQPIQLLQNQMRAAHMTVNITPLNEDADDDTAEVLRDLYRRESQRGGAENARFWGYDRAMKAGTGAYALDTDYDDESDNPHDQRIVWRRIWDGGNVYFDPVVMEANPREMEYAFELQAMRHSKIKREWPESDLALYDDGELKALAEREPDWIKVAEENDEPICTVAIYWRKEYDEKTWVILDDASFAYSDEIPKGRTVHPQFADRVRKVQVPRVMRSVLCGNEELEPAEEWNGKFIPLIPTIGIELQPFDGERRCHGIIEPAMGAVKLKNWTASTIVEGVGSETKSPWLMWEGQDEGYEAMWQQAAVRNFPALKMRPTLGPDGQLLPPPTKIQGDLGRIAPGLELLQLSDQFLQSATTTLDQGRIEQMGRRRVAHQTIQSVQEQSDAGNSHYMLNMQTVSMPYEAEVWLDLAPHIYDRPGRVMRLLDFEDEPKRPIMLNQPFQMDPRTKRPVAIQTDADGDGLPDGAKHYDLTKGRYAISVTIGKGYQDRLQEGASEMANLIGGDPELMTVLGPTYLKYLTFPGAREAGEMLKRLRSMKFPGIDTDPDDPQAKQDVASLTHENQALKAQLQQASQLLEQEGLKLQTQERIADKKNAVDMVKSREANEVKLAVAELGAKVERMGLFLDERARLGTQVHDTAMAAADAGHDELMADKAHQQAQQLASQQAAQGMVAADQGHQQALEQGAQGHQQTLESQQQAADLAPEPEAGA